MTEILFFQLRSSPVEKQLPVMLQRSLARGQRVVVEFASEERLAAADDYLWTFDDASFLPHGTAKEPGAAGQPVLLTTEPHNPNRASVRICAEGVRIPDTVDEYERFVLIFDGDVPEALAAAREDWRKVKAAGKAASYWQLDESGRWEKKA